MGRPAGTVGAVSCRRVVTGGHDALAGAVGQHPAGRAQPAYQACDLGRRERGDDAVDRDESRNAWVHGLVCGFAPVELTAAEETADRGAGDDDSSDAGEVAAGDAPDVAGRVDVGHSRYRAQV